MHYSYHGRNKQRIRNGELIDFYYTYNYPRMDGEVMVLVFNTEPFKRPIRPHKYCEYFKLINEYFSKDKIERKD